MFNLNPDPKTDPNPNPKSKNNVCSTKRYQMTVQQSVIYTSYFRKDEGRVYRRPITAKQVPLTI